MTINWSTVETAIHAWVVSGSGLSATQVIWSGQNSPRPSGQYIAISLEVQSIGLDWLDTTDAAAPAPEEELDYFSRGTRQMTIGLQCFGGSHRGSGSSRALLDSVKASLPLPSVHDALVAAGIGVGSFSPILNVGQPVTDTVFEPRASMDVTAYLASEVSETGTYISDVSGDNNITDPPESFLIESGV